MSFCWLNPRLAYASKVDGVDTFQILGDVAQHVLG